MHTLLTIDTSSSRCSVALLRAGVLSERVSDAARQSAQRVLPMISELLLDAKISLADLDLIAVVAGPGSFTGVRIGVAVAQGLGLSSGTPVLALSSLALAAMATLAESRQDGVLVSEVARDGELYFAAYTRSSVRGVELLGREQLASIDEIDALPADLAATSWCLAGNGWARREEILRHLACNAIDEPKIPAIQSQVIANLAGLRFDCAEAVDAAQLRPNYVKEQLDYT